MSTPLAPAAFPTGIPRRANLDDQGRMAAIDKAFVLYELLSDTNRPMRLSDLSRRSGVPKSTTHRLLRALMASGQVVRFGVGYQAMERSGGARPAANGPRDLLRRLAPFVGDLMVRTRLTASLAVLQDTDVVFAHRVYGHDSARTPSDDSGRECAYRTAAGRLLLSHQLRAACDLAAEWGLAAGEAADLNRELVRIRHRRFSIGERVGIRCVAVRVPAGPGRPDIALTVKGEVGLVDQDRALFWLRKIADEAARAMIDTRNRTA
jgi:DNA-binding IclR family transcriptional regulator